MIPRHGEQSPVVIISYMGYSPPKCKCHSNQSHSSKYMILLECLHAKSHVSSPHRLPHTCLSLMREKHRFQNKRFFVLENTLPSFGKYIGLPFEANCWIIFPNSHGSASEMNCWTTLQANSSENLSFTTIFTFLFIFVSCTHTYHSRVPRSIWNALCHFQTIDANIFYLYILTKINSHANHISHVIQFTINNTKISSHELITIQAIYL